MRSLYVFRVVVTLAAAFLFAFSAMSQAQTFSQQGGKLVGTGAVGQAFQGGSVALSADGNTALVGGWTDNNDVGAAWVYTRTGGVWTQQGGKLVGTGAVGQALQGSSVALSGDGNTALVGGWNDNGNGSVGVGAVWVFTQTGGVWTQQGSKLVGTGAVGPASQGPVALSADGNTALVGGPADNNGTGAVWVFTRAAGVWTQQGGKLAGTDAVGQAGQGASVALSGDGNTAVVGGPVDDNGVGAAWVYTRTGGVWTQQGSKLVGTGAAGTASQGQSVALSGNGITALVGGPVDNDGIGAVWVYLRTGDVWTQQGSKLVGTGGVGQALQGDDVALSGDGNAALFSGPFDDNRLGAVWFFTLTAGVWMQEGGKLVGTGAVGTPGPGFSAVEQGAVALSADSNTALVGGPFDNNRAGAVWVFTRASQDTTPPVIVPQVSGTSGENGWYRGSVTVTWSVADAESGIASSSGCEATHLTNDTAGVTLTCSATNGAGLSASVPITIKIDQTPPAISGLPAPGCSIWPPNHKLVQVAAVTANDGLSGIAPGSFTVTATSNDATNGRSVITRHTDQIDIQLEADKGAIYTLTAAAKDLAGNVTSNQAICTVPQDQGK
jgi:hypothetical protein